MTNDKVTVVIPVYNSEKFLIPTIESVLNQSYQNLEIIAVDDGSADKSLEILQKYQDKIKIFHQENQGLAFAVNLAIKKMNGKWLKWLSPDDVLFPNTIETLVAEAKNKSENTILYSNWEIIDENNKKLRIFSESNFNDLEIFDFNVRLLDGQQINVNTTLIPSNLFKQGCTFKELQDPVAIDYEFFLNAGICYNVKFHLVDKVLLQYRIHPKQLSHKNIPKTLEYIEEIKTQILSKLDESKKNQYLKTLQEYRRKKTLSKKTMEIGLKIASITFPDWLTDKLLIFYLNKIRRTR